MPQRKRAAAQVAEKNIKALEAIESDEEIAEDIPESKAGGEIAGAAAKAKLGAALKQPKEKPIAGAAAKAKLTGEPISKINKIEKMEKEADEVEKSQTAGVKGTRKGAQKQVCLNANIFYFSVQYFLFLKTIC